MTYPIVSKYFQCHSHRTERNFTRFAACALAVVGLLLTACNTTRGFGEDIERVGNEIQEEVR